MARSMPVVFADDAAPPVEVSTEVLKKQFKERFADLAEALAEVPRYIGDYSPTELSVSFALSANGELSLLSAPRDGLGAAATFQVKLIRQVPD